MNETLKQQQFNEAMARYTSCQGYKFFGTCVAVANIILQLLLAYQVAAYSIGPARQLSCFLLAYLITDFVNGLVHMFMDCNDRYDSPVGPLIANFHLHHKTPLYRKNRLWMVYFTETGSKVWLVGYLLTVAVMMNARLLHPLAAYTLVYVGILSSLAEVSHYLCHSSNAAPVRFMAECGMILSKRHHARHHLEDNINYAFLNGWSDPLINLIARSCSSGYKRTTDRHFACYENGDTESR